MALKIEKRGILSSFFFGFFRLAFDPATLVWHEIELGYRFEI